MPSGSRTNLRQYLLFRALRIEADPVELMSNAASFGLDRWIERARKELGQDRTWQQYRRTFGQTPRRGATLFLVHLLKEVCQGRIIVAGAGNLPAVPAAAAAAGAGAGRLPDEELVMLAAYSFLNAVTYGLARHSILLPDRLAFTATFRRAQYEADGDGCLLDTRSGRVNAIVEVKPARRSNRIRMQETAEMVAWLFDANQPPVG
ncbi:hypothetical protein B7463_g3481, partial [Scytalidium lignicola]